jgi:hypothetical protein
MSLWYEDMAWSGRFRSKFCWNWLAATVGSTLRYSIEPDILMVLLIVVELVWYEEVIVGIKLFDVIVGLKETGRLMY